MIKRSTAADYKHLFEGVDTKNMQPSEIQLTKKLYDYLVESQQVAEEEGKKLGDVLDEGILSGILGGLAGSTIGPAIGRAICKVLGINESGVLGNLLMSRLVLGALGAELGFRI